MPDANRSCIQCGSPLVRRANEWPGQWAKRVACSQRCTGKLRAQAQRARPRSAAPIAVVASPTKRTLPTLPSGVGIVRGPGDRMSSCARYAECLDAFAHAHDDGVNGHCPTDCRGFKQGAPAISIWDALMPERESDLEGE